MGNIIVTGATGAIGGAAVKRLREMGHNVIGTSRRAEHEGFYPLDISSPRSIAAFAERLSHEGIAIDGLLNNAGTIARRYEVTAEGFELVTATNYLGTYLLTRKLLPMMNEGAHVVCTASLSCYVARLGRDFFDLSADNYRQIKAYSNSKMALVYFAQELHRRYGKQLHVNLTDPGIVNSRMIHLDRWFDSLADIAFRPFVKSPQQGAVPAVRALTTDCKLQLFRGYRQQDIPRRWQDEEFAAWLWEETEQHLEKVRTESGGAEA